jgi:hypothetical protein
LASCAAVRADWAAGDDGGTALVVAAGGVVVLGVGVDEGAVEGVGEVVSAPLEQALRARMTTAAQAAVRTDLTIGVSCGAGMGQGAADQTSRHTRTTDFLVGCTAHGRSIPVVVGTTRIARIGYIVRTAPALQR